jgi:hypothetical protein
MVKLPSTLDFYQPHPPGGFSHTSPPTKVFPEGLSPLLDSPIKQGIGGKAPVGREGWERKRTVKERWEGGREIKRGNTF